MRMGLKLSIGEYNCVSLTHHNPTFASSFRMDYTCPVNCSGHGRCLDNGTCECDSEWYGDHCDFPICPNNCSSNGECDLDTLTCSCSPGYGGTYVFLQLPGLHLGFVQEVAKWLFLHGVGWGGGVPLDTAMATYIHL